MEGNIIMDNDTKRMIILDNYQEPRNNKVPENKEEYIKLNSNNTSCIDNIDIYLKLENNIIKDIKFNGEACAISTSTTSIMIKLFLNKTVKEAYEILTNYENMINEQPYNEEILGEALAYDEIYKQENRKHCALLPWNGIKELLQKYI